LLTFQSILFVIEQIQSGSQGRLVMRKYFPYFRVLKAFNTALIFKLFMLVVLVSLVPFGLASAEEPPPTEVDEVTIWMRSGPEDWIFGYADPSAFVTVENETTPLFTVQADDQGYWSSPDPLELNPGDTYTITAGAGLNPIEVFIPTPFTVEADSFTDHVWGQIDHLDTETVGVRGDWPGGHQDVLTDGNGNFTATYADVPYGGHGEVAWHTMVDYADIYFRQEFRTPDLILETHYSYDWIQAHYDAGNTVNLTVYESNQTIAKATAEVETGPVPQWEGGTGFFTGMGDPWSPEAPDIQPGDWVYALVDNGYEAMVQIGEINGTVNTSGDSVSGTLNASWLMPGPVDIECMIWEEAGPAAQYDSITPNNTDPYSCNWNAVWDILPGDHVQVAYTEPDGHVVLREVHERAPHLAIEKFFIGNGSPGEGGNAAFYIRYINKGDAPAENVTITDTLDGLDYLGDSSGLPILLFPDHVVWQVGTLNPGDWIDFAYTAEVLGTEGDAISNTVDITTTTSTDLGEPSEKTSTWEGEVAPNDTHLKVWKEVWTWNPAPGEDYVYQVNVCNDGGTGSSTLTLTETLPAAASYNTWWSSEAGWYQIGQTGQNLELLNYSLPPGTCSEVFINVTLDEGTIPGDELVNLVEISADNDIETEDNIAALYHEVGEALTDAAVWQEWHSGSLVPGGEYRLGVGFKNTGNVLINAPIEITATLPSGVTYQGSNLSPSSLISNVVTWQIGSDLVAGTEGMIELQLAIDPGVAPDSVLNHIADITIPDDDENPDNDHHELAFLVRDHGINLRVRKSGNWEGYETGQVAWWMIQVENIGDVKIEDIELRDYYPDEMELLAGINVSYWDDWEWEDNNPDDNAFRVYLEGLEPGQSMNIHYRTYVRDDVTLLSDMQFANFVEAQIDGDIEPESNTSEHILLHHGFNLFLPLILN
jgi:hypothetical protein